MRLSGISVDGITPRFFCMSSWSRPVATFLPFYSYTSLWNGWALGAAEPAHVLSGLQDLFLSHDRAFSLGRVSRFVYNGWA
jgi:hypothetical protein